MPARYGESVVGGAEVALAELGHGLRARGYDVEVLTTCAVDHFSWENVLPPGVSTTEDGVVVRRFPAVVSTSGAERGELEAAILRGERLTAAQQMRWMNDGVRVPGLWHHLLDSAADYRALVFAPYPFWPTYACSQVAPERSVVMTCLHDEPYAYLDIFTPVFQGSAALWFLSPPEQELARRIASPLAPHDLVGCGVGVPESYDVAGFRERHGLGDRRFVLYAGRREGAKRWEALLEGYAAAVARHDLPLDLVTMGAGEVRPPASVADRVVDLGFLPDSERDNAFAAAEAYLQPSRVESFSRTVMEAWLAGTPVIADGAGEVVRHHIEHAHAGLLYDDDLELGQCLAFVAQAPEAAARLAANGRRYVLENYTWPLVLDRMEASLDAHLPLAATGAAGSEGAA